MLTIQFYFHSFFFILFFLSNFLGSKNSSLLLFLFHVNKNKQTGIKQEDDAYCYYRRFGIVYTEVSAAFQRGVSLWSRDRAEPVTCSNSAMEKKFA